MTLTILDILLIALVNAATTFTMASILTYYKRKQYKKAYEELQKVVSAQMRQANKGPKLHPSNKPPKDDNIH